MERLCVMAGLVLSSGMDVLMKGVGSGLFCVEAWVSRAGEEKDGKWKDKKNAQQHSTPESSETQPPDSQLDNLK